MNSAKNMLCPLCKRRFGTKQALAQHRMDAHGGGKSSPSKPKGASKRMVQARSSNYVAPLSVPTPNSSTITVSGEDRVANVLVTSSSDIFRPFPVEAGLSPRLSALARAYQRIKWISLTFFVAPQAPVTTLGGYLAGFVMDPADVSVTLSQLSACQGSATKKWYETAEVRMPRVTDDFYTSAGNEIRLTSPGVFWLASDGKPAQSLNVVITARWTVQLSKPFLSSSLVDDLITPVALKSLKSNYCLQTTSGVYKFADWFGSMNLDSSANHYFRCPSFNIEYKEGTGDTGTVQMHYVVYNRSDQKLYYSNTGTGVDNTTWQNDVEERVVIPCGSVLKYVGTGNLPCPVSRSLHSSDLPGSTSTDKPVEEDTLRLSQALEKLRRCWINMDEESKSALTDSTEESIIKWTLLDTSP